MSQVTLKIDSDVREMMRVCRITMAQESLLEFMRFMYEEMGRAFLVGRHTARICARIDKALNDLYRYGISSNIILTVPFRHGKSEIVSRYLGPYVIGKFGSIPENNPMGHDVEFMLGSYGATLSGDLSKSARGVCADPSYREVFPNVRFSSTAVEGWQTEAADTGRVISKFHASGLGGGVTGKGAVVQVIDDYLRNREDAESQTFRDKQWESFTNDFGTRLAPAYLRIVCATRWHVDDVIGRILEKNDPESDKYDPDFPKFDVLHFRAKDEDGNYLWPERFKPKWYEDQFATLGPYGAPALLQGEPISRGGNMLPVDKIEVLEAVPRSILENALPTRFWDLASTEAEVAKDDADATVGARGFVWFEGAKPSDEETMLKPHLFVTDCRIVRKLATARNDLIVSTARADGPRVWQGVESVAGYKDAYDTVAGLLRGTSIVHKITVHRDKFARISDRLHPVMDAGRVHFVKAWWNSDAFKELAQFPNGSHDDVADAIAGLYAMAYSRALTVLRSGYAGGAGLSGGRSVMRRKSS